jgi:hypothetical protein
VFMFIYTGINFSLRVHFICTHVYIMSSKLNMKNKSLYGITNERAL